MEHFRTQDKDIATHNGMAPTIGKWVYPEYAESASAREVLFNTLVKLRSKSKQFAIMENIKSLPAATLIRVRFDIDTTLITDEPEIMTPYIDKFIDTLYSILYEYTSLPTECDCRIIVQKKPAPTLTKEGTYKHGLKVTCIDLLATHAQMLQLRDLMHARFSEWGDESWLNGTTLEKAQIIDKCVYTKIGWLMYGSQKANQKAGGYEATDLWIKPGEKDNATLSDHSYYELVQMLSIFADTGAEDDTEDLFTLSWSKKYLSQQSPNAPKVQTNQKTPA
jgi:hypothetical protein